MTNKNELQVTIANIDLTLEGQKFLTKWLSATLGKVNEVY